MACHSCRTQKSSVSYHAIARTGGGSYRRGPRTLHVTMCEPCICELHQLAAKTSMGPTDTVGAWHYHVSSLQVAFNRIREKEAKR